MKKVFMTMVLLVLFSSVAVPADKEIEWKESQGAVGYKAETSEDLGATWTEVQNLTYTTRIEGALNLATATITVADNVLVLVRVGAFNNAGTSWRLESGAWINTAWQPLPSPTGAGIN